MYILKRSPHNPILQPSTELHWESYAAFNGCPVQNGKTTHLLYRAMGRADPLRNNGQQLISVIGHAESFDSEYFGNKRLFITPEESWEKYGCEDPRTTYFEGRYYTFYTALSNYPFSAANIKVACAVSNNLESVIERHLVTPFNAKAMTLFPERINGKVTVILSAHTDEPPVKTCIAQADSIEELWSEDFWKKWHARHDDFKIAIRRSEDDHVEIGSPPVQTDEGWLLVYSYIKNYFKGGERVFGIEALLLDLDDPRTIVGRTQGALLVPEEPYELFGTVSNISFPSGALIIGDRLDIFYGAADTVCAKASVYLPDLLDAMLPERRKSIVTRGKENPILSPRPDHSWESRAVFNAGAIDSNGVVRILYRAMSEDNTSVFGLAESVDGLTISKRHDTPVYVPREDFEVKKGSPTGNSGCEDPRITKIGDTLYVAYVSYNGVEPPRVAITSITEKDFIAGKFDTWAKPVVISPAHVMDKDACLFSRKINGKYVLLHRIEPQVCADFLDDLTFEHHAISTCVEILRPRQGMWDSVKVGIAGPPIFTEKGWLLIYHGVSADAQYSLGAALLSLDDPSVIIGRTVDPILSPQEPYELHGQIPNVVFSCGAVVRNDTLYLYYGGGDSVIGVATLSLSKLLQSLNPKIFQS